MSNGIPEAVYFGTWLLQPELCIYEEGEIPTSGRYTIDRKGTDIRVGIDWTAAAGTEHQIEYQAPADGERKQLPASEGGPTHLSLAHVDAHTLDSYAFIGEREVAYARRAASRDGALLATVQAGQRADGTPFRNFQVYRREVTTDQ